MTALLVALGAAAGAPLRYLAAHFLDETWPRGTLMVNILGSGLIGFFSALSLSDHAWALLGVGFCGALTSYSSFVVQALDRGPRRGGAYAVVTVGASIALCFLGFALASSI